MEDQLFLSVLTLSGEPSVNKGAMGGSRLIRTCSIPVSVVSWARHLTHLTHLPYCECVWMLVRVVAFLQMWTLNVVWMNNDFCEMLWVPWKALCKSRPLFLILRRHWRHYLFGNGHLVMQETRQLSHHRPSNTVYTVPTSNFIKIFCFAFALNISFGYQSADFLFFPPHFVILVL